MRNLIILLLFAVTTFSACNSGRTGNGLSVEEMQDILTSQKWRFDIPKIDKGLGELKSKIPPSQYSIATGALKRVQFASFEFTKDHKIFLDLNTGRPPTQGTWVFTEKGDELILTFTSTKAIPHVIRNFSKEQIYLEADIKNGIQYPKIFIPLAEGAGKEQKEKETKQEKED